MTVHDLDTRDAGIGAQEVENVQATRINEAWERLRAAADFCARRGSLIFHLDLATEAARVALVAHEIDIDTLVTLVDEQGYRVFAFDRAPLPNAVAEVRFGRDGSAIINVAPDRVPPAIEPLMRAHRTIAATRVAAASSGRAIILPSNDPRGPFAGYTIVTASADRMLLDGHESHTLSPDGRRVTTSRKIVLGIGATRTAGSDASAAILETPGAVPDELHTYLSLKHGVPLLIATRESGVRWRVDGERTTTP